MLLSLGVGVGIIVDVAVVVSVSVSVECLPTRGHTFKENLLSLSQHQATANSSSAGLRTSSSHALSLLGF